MTCQHLQHIIFSHHYLSLLIIHPIQPLPLHFSQISPKQFETHATLPSNLPYCSLPQFLLLLPDLPLYSLYQSSEIVPKLLEYTNLFLAPCNFLQATFLASIRLFISSDHHPSDLSIILSPSYSFPVAAKTLSLLLNQTSSIKHPSLTLSLSLSNLLPPYELFPNWFLIVVPN